MLIQEGDKVGGALDILGGGLRVGGSMLGAREVSKWTSSLDDAAESTVSKEAGQKFVNGIAKDVLADFKFEVPIKFNPDMPMTKFGSTVFWKTGKTELPLWIEVGPRSIKAGVNETADTLIHEWCHSAASDMTHKEIESFIRTYYGLKGW